MNTLTEEAITAEAYAHPTEYIPAMKTIAELGSQIGEELKGQVHDELLQKYQDIVKQLITEIDGIMNNQHSSEITWEDAERVAELQLQICEIVTQML